MKADRIEVSWDDPKSKWLVRIFAGEEVLRRHCDLPKDSSEDRLRAAAEKTAADDGYTVSAADIAIAAKAAQ